MADTVVVLGAGGRNGVGGTVSMNLAAEQHADFWHVCSLGACLSARQAIPLVIRHGYVSPHPAAIVQVYWTVHKEHRSAWRQELDLRPFKEDW